MAGAPAVTHGGFLVPNAAQASPGNPATGVEWARMAEIDQVDFNTLSQTHRWAVLRGCQVTVAGKRASLINGANGELGLALVDGKLVEAIANTSDELGPGQQQDRFDLVVLTASGNLKVIQGTPDFDPVLPDPGLDQTVLAAVFCPTSEQSFSDCVIDKRVMAPSALLTKVADEEYLIRNIKDMTQNLFSVRGSGQMVWGNDATIRRVDVGTFSMEQHLNLTGNLQANGDATAENLVARNLVSSKNLIQGNDVVGDEPKGALRQAPDGRLFLNGPDGWIEMATIEATAPTGTIIQSVKMPSEMPGGWVQMSGISINELNHPELFKLAMMDQFIHKGAGQPVAPQRVMTLPNLTDRILIGTIGTPGYSGSANFTLTKANLPPHNHDVRIALDGGNQPTASTGPEGGHTHNQLQDGINPSGEHVHGTQEDPHRHDAMDYPGQVSHIIAEVWGGQNKIDGPINDGSHTSSVEPLRWTSPASTGLKVTQAGSGHTHLLSTQPHHQHTVAVSAIPPHTHVVSQSDVGSGTPIDVHQPAFSVYMYIKD